MITILLPISMAIILAAGIIAFSGLIQPNIVWRRLSLLLMLPGLAGITIASVWVMAGDLQVFIPLFEVSELLAVNFYLDRLAAFFIMVICVVSACVAVYSLGYVEHHPDSRKRQWSIGLMAIFILSMIGVVASDNYFALLLNWEIMSLSSFFLVIIDNKQTENLKAGIYYLVMTQLSTVFLFFSCLITYSSTGTMVVNASIPAMASLNLVLAGFLLGFGTKAGLIPLHKWLPYAHSAAPSNISALMSGVMLKVAIYGLARITLNLESIPLGWGLILLGMGTLSAVLGVIYALKEHDLKKLLAYHSIENIGIIVIGLGLYSIFTFYSLELLALASLAGALFHSLNHALFKALLFMCSGNVINAVSTRNIEQMGGLVKRMPATAAIFLVGAAAISALPPLNGFASEILLFQSYLGAFQIPSLFVAIGVFASLAAFALMSALAAACFVKAFGITFLAIPRSEAAAQAHEASPSMVAAPAILAGLCVILGVGSFHFFNMMGLDLPVPDLLPVTIIIITVSLFALVIIRCLKIPVRKIETWNCGSANIDPRTEYTATGFSQPILNFFSPIFRTREIIERSFTDVSRSVIHHGKAEIKTMQIFEERIYLPVARLAMRIGRRVSNWQNGDLDNFILYGFITIVISLLAAGWWL
ncbi:MAG: proton-conducting transporter membrane subunit [Dehalococcoidales bacterium]|nr:proton-conducting transporter membrane subunit [Dehalococcoidales bacterium]MDX9803410.1 proton-conducting transporter membrane subunit [Dehalococcoidales bacterium]